MMTCVTKTGARLRAALLAGAATAASLFIAGCNDDEKSEVRYTDIRCFLAEFAHTFGRITARTESSADMATYQTHTAAGVGFLPVTEEGAKITNGENAWFNLEPGTTTISGEGANHGSAKIMDLPVGSVYSSSDAVVFLPGKGAALDFGPNYELLLTAGNQVLVPSFYMTVRYHTAWTIPEDGVYYDNYTPKSGRTDTNGHDPNNPGQGSGYNVWVHDYDMPGYGRFVPQGDTEGYYEFSSTYPVYVSTNNALGVGEARLVLPVGKHFEITDASLMYPPTMTPGMFTRLNAVTHRPMYYWFVPAAGVVTHRDTGLPFNDGQLSLPEGALMVLPDSDVIFRQGDADRPITVKLDGTVELWPGSSYEIDQEGWIEVVDTPGYYHIAKRVFVPYSAGSTMVSFDENGGDTTHAPQEFLVGFRYGAYSALPAAERAGYYFLGWHNGGGVHVTDMTPVPAGEHTLTARWIAMENVYHVANAAPGSSTTVVFKGDDPFGTFPSQWLPGYRDDTEFAMAAIESDRAPEIVIVFGNDVIDRYNAVTGSIVFNGADTVTHLRGHVFFETKGGDDSILQAGGNAKVNMDVIFDGANDGLFIGMRDSAEVTQNGGFVTATAAPLLSGMFFGGAGLRLQDQASFVMNGGLLIPAGLLPMCGIMAGDTASVTINGGTIAGAPSASYFLMADNATLRINGGTFGFDRDIVRTFSEMYEDNWLANLFNLPDLGIFVDWLSQTFLRNLPVSVVGVMQGSPEIEIYGGDFRCGLTMYASREMMVDMLGSFAAHVLELVGGSGVASETKEQFLQEMTDLLMLPATPTVTIHRGVFHNLANLVVSDPDEVLSIGDTLWNSEHKNVILAEGACLGVNEDYCGGEPMVVGIYEKDAITNAHFQITHAMVAAYADGGDGMWPTEAIQTIYDDCLAMVPENGQVVVRGGAPWQEFFLPEGSPDKFFAIVGDDLVYTLVDITVSYHANGGWFEVADTDVLEAPIALDSHDNRLYYDDAVEAPVLADHTFYGWNTSPNGTGEWLEDVTYYAPGSSPRAVYAQWEAAATPTVDVVFFANGGEFWDGGIAEPVNYAFGDLFDSALPQEPEREDHTFMGWASRNGTVVIDEYTEVSATSPRRFYAQWESDYDELPVINFYAEYDAFTGEGDLFDTVPQTPDDPVALPVYTPEKIQHAFDGWHTLDGLRVTKATVFATPPPLLVAKWRYLPVGFAVVFDANGGVFDDGQAQKIMDLITDPVSGLCLYEYPGETVELAEHVLVGWNTARDGSGEWIDHATYYVDGASAKTLYAQWEPVGDATVLVTYCANEGVFPSGTNILTAVCNLGRPIWEGGWVLEPTRDGYTFVNWVTQSGEAWYAYMIVTAETPREFYAQWQEVSAPFDIAINFYTEFDRVAGSGELYDTVAQPDSPYVTLTGLGDPEKEGWIFTGWHTLDGLRVTEGKYLYSLPPLLVAGWKPATFTVYLDGTSGGYVTLINNYTKKVTVTYGQPMPPIVPPVADDPSLVFLGYAYVDDLNDPTDATVYYNSHGNSAQNWDRMQDGLTLHGMWDMDGEDRVYYHGNGGGIEVPFGSTSVFLDMFSVGADHGLYVLPEDVGYTLFRDGHLFIGWNTDPSGNGDWITNETPYDPLIPSPKHVYAQWISVEDYLVAWHATDGAFPDTSIVQYTYATDFVRGVPRYVFPGDNPDFAGHTFRGWNTEPDGSGDWIVVKTPFFPGESARDVYAVWKDSGDEDHDTVVVVWHTNHSDYEYWNEPVAQYTTNTFGSAYDVPATPAIGNIFLGWFTADGAEEVDISTEFTAESPRELFAHWHDEDFNMVFFYSNFNGDFDTSEHYYWTEVGINMWIPPAPSHPDGLEFDGWYTKNGVDVDTAMAFLPPAPALFARWSELGEYRVRFDANEGEFAGATGVAQYVQKLPPMQPEPALDLWAYQYPQDPVRDGHAFIGWNTEPDGTGLWIEALTFYVQGESAQRLYAQWEFDDWGASAVMIRVTYNANEGEFLEGHTVTNITTVLNWPYVLPAPDPVRQGYVFAGWFSANSTFEATGGTPLEAKTPRTLYAAWRATEVYPPVDLAINFYAEYDIASGTGDLHETVVQTVGQPIAFPGAHPVKPGHTFVDWFTLDGVKVPDSLIIDESIVLPLLVARWEPSEDDGDPLTLIITDIQVFTDGGVEYVSITVTTHDDDPSPTRQHSLFLSGTDDLADPLKPFAALDNFLLDEHDAFLSPRTILPSVLKAAPQVFTFKKPVADTFFFRAIATPQ